MSQSFSGILQYIQITSIPLGNCKTSFTNVISFTLELKFSIICLKIDFLLKFMNKHLDIQKCDFSKFGYSEDTQTPGLAETLVRYLNGCISECLQFLVGVIEGLCKACLFLLMVLHISLHLSHTLLQLRKPLLCML